MTEYYGIHYDSVIEHHGIKGQKWGVRRYQNPDGTLTPEGRKRLGYRNNILRNRPHTDDVNDIVRSLSNKEKKLLGASLHEEWIAEKTNIGSNVLAKKYGFEQKKTPDNSDWKNYNRYIRKTKRN